MAASGESSRGGGEAAVGDQRRQATCRLQCELYGLWFQGAKGSRGRASGAPCDLGQALNPGSWAPPGSSQLQLAMQQHRCAAASGPAARGEAGRRPPPAA